jgi:hypothetical protein
MENLQIRKNDKHLKEVVHQVHHQDHHLRPHLHLHLRHHHRHHHLRHRKIIQVQINRKKDLGY